MAVAVFTSLQRARSILIGPGLALLLVLSCRHSAVMACPFCTALKPSLSQQRDAAAAVALVELSKAEPGRSVFLVHKLLKGPESLRGAERITIAAETSLKPGALAVLFGSPAEEAPAELRWTVVGFNEASYAYFARAPSLRTPATERLKYFAPFLEHRDPLIADDAYLEFGHAPFDTIARAVEVLPMDRIRRWMTDAKIPPERKGFYGLALGLARSEADRSSNAKLLHDLILLPENDFRAGFDGVLGGYLMLAGEPGLELLEELLIWATSRRPTATCVTR